MKDQDGRKECMRRREELDEKEDLERITDYHRRT